MSLLAATIKGVRGIDSRDIVADHRNQVRRVVDLAANCDLRRHNEFHKPKLKDEMLKRVRPVLSTRGGDMRHIISEGRKKAQHNKAHNPFTKLEAAPVFTQKY